MIQQDNQMLHLFSRCRTKTPSISFSNLYGLFYYPLQFLSAFERVYFREPE